MRKLLLIGAGGHGRVAADCAEAMGCFSEISFADASYPNNTHNSHWRIIGDDSYWSHYIEHYEFIVSIGNNQARLALSEKIEQLGGKLATLIHPQATISKYANIGAGSVVFANAAINVNCQLGVATIVNTGATIDHDCTIGNGCHIAPGVNISGTTTLGNRVWVGVGSTIIQNLSLTDDVYIGAGAVIVNDLKQSGTYVGVPAKRIK
ncbi:acetyltransferase [Thalassotalea euphylliae]|uniref:acetyltransferase n=1 Tax=Thalassotalea euphylliae TaxID=1655234 RepID=UPI0036369485